MNHRLALRRAFVCGAVSVALAGCAHASVATSNPVNNGPPAASAPTPDTSGISQQISGIDTQLNTIDSQLSDANAGLSTSEGDPSK
jgi:hypothetical protein